MTGRLAKACITATLAALLCSCSGDKYITIQGFAQGGEYTVKLNLMGRNGMIHRSPEKIKADIDSILTEIDTTLSGYNKKSLLSRFNAGERIPLRKGSIFTDIYRKAWDFYEETDGAIDVSGAPLFDLWGFGFTRDSLPSRQEIDRVLESCGMNRLRRNMDSIAASTGTIAAPDLILLRDSATKGSNSSADKNNGKGSYVELNYNAIAQGYSCDLVAQYLYGIGVKDMLVDIGEIFCDGSNPNGEGWKIGIDRPIDGNNSPGQDIVGVWQSGKGPCGIVTSGNYRKFYIHNGKKYAHTIDPRTGYPVNHTLLSATIAAPDATSADAYATYCMVIGLDQAKKFIAKKEAEGISGYLVYSAPDGKMQEWASRNFFTTDAGQ